MSYQQQPMSEQFVYDNEYNVGTPYVPPVHTWVDAEGYDDGLVWKDGE